MLAIGAGGFVIAGRSGWATAFLASAALMLAVVPFTLSAPRLPPIQHQVTSLRQAVVGPAREFLHRSGGPRAVMLLALVLLYRWPDGLLGVMAVPFLLQQGFSPEVVGTVQAGWGIAATIVGTVLGGILFGRLGMNRSLWLFALLGAAGNLSYAVLAHFGGGMAALLAAVGLENLSGGMVGAAFGDLRPEPFAALASGGHPHGKGGLEQLLRAERPGRATGVPADGPADPLERRGDQGSVRSAPGSDLRASALRASALRASALRRRRS